MKKLLAIISLAFISLTANAQCDMFYSKCATLYGINSPVDFSMEIQDIYIQDTAGYQYYEYGLFQEGPGWYKILKYSTMIASMGPGDCYVDTSLYWYDSNHSHYHLNLITTTLSDDSGNVLTSSKIGYDFADRSKYYPDSCVNSELAPYGGWTNPEVPPNPTFNSLSPGMTKGYSDFYGKNTIGNWIQLGYYTNYPDGYVGLDDGVYLMESEANFAGVTTDGESADYYPNDWWSYITISGYNVEPFAVNPPQAPGEVLVIYDFKGGQDPIVAWLGDPAGEYEVERFIKKGNNIIGVVDLTPIMVTGTGFTDIIEHIQLAAQTYFPPSGAGVKFFYRVRGVNAAGTSDWMYSQDVKL